MDRVATDNFTGFTPESVQELAAERVLLRELHEKNCWERAADASWSALLPEGCVVRFKPEQSVWFVVRAFACAALLWPAVETAPKVWQEQLDITELTWKVCFDLAEWEELPIEYASPLHMAFQAFGQYAMLDTSVKARAQYLRVARHDSVR